MPRDPQRPRQRKGCVLIALVAAALVAVCGGVASLIGYSIWSDPRVQRGVQIAGAAVEMTRAAADAPGAAQLRAAGCLQAMVYTPEIIARFSDAVRPDAGHARGVPEHPIVVCIVGAQSSLGCEDVARTYASALTPAPARVGVTLQTQGSAGATCQGVYGPDGAFVREAGAHQRRIGDQRLRP